MTVNRWPAALVMILTTLGPPDHTAHISPQDELLAERIPSWDEGKRAYVQAEIGRESLKTALREESQHLGVTLSAQATDLILTEALSAEAARRKSVKTEELPHLHAATRKALVNYLRELVDDSHPDGLPTFSVYLSKAWGGGGLAFVPRRNVYGKLEVAVEPSTLEAEVWVDESRAGTSRRRIVLPEGTHQVNTKDPRRGRECREEVKIEGRQILKIFCDLQ